MFFSRRTVLDGRSFLIIHCTGCHTGLTSDPLAKEWGVCSSSGRPCLLRTLRRRPLIRIPDPLVVPNKNVLDCDASRSSMSSSRTLLLSDFAFCAFRLKRRFLDRSCLLSRSSSSPIPCIICLTYHACANPPPKAEPALPYRQRPRDEHNPIGTLIIDLNKADNSLE